MSNVASASRAILSKGLMSKPIGENLNAPNLCVPPASIPPVFLSRPNARPEPVRAAPLHPSCFSHPPSTPSEFAASVQSGSFHAPSIFRFSCTSSYAVLTIIAFAFLLPMSLVIESPATIKAAVDAAVAGGTSLSSLVTISALSGVYYYLYNEVAFLALSQVAPVTHGELRQSRTVVDDRPALLRSKRETASPCAYSPPPLSIPSLTRTQLLVTRSSAW